MVRILQISDLLINSNSSTETLFRTFRRGISHGYQFDYLIVCGNITEDGLPESFRQAQIFLQSLVDLTLAHHSSKLHRVILVPGEKDTLAENENNRLLAFQEFYQCFFEDVTECPNLNLHQVILRELKDFTFLSACYWHEDEDNPELYQAFLQAIDDATQGLSELTYCSKTPTILVTSGTPILRQNSNLTHDPNLITLLERLERTYKVNLHLFGSGAISYILHEPFSFSRASLGTGPRSRESYFPLRINVIELETKIEAQQAFPFTSVQTLETSKSGIEWRSHEFVSGKSTSLRENPESKIRKIMALALWDVIGAALIHNPSCMTFILQGFPGCGRYVLLNYLAESEFRHMTSGNTTFVVAAASWEQYSQVAVIVRRKLQAWREHSLAQGSQGVMIFFDGAFGRASVSDRLENLQSIQDFAQAFAQENIKTIHCIETWNNEEFKRTVHRNRNLMKVLPLEDEKFFQAIENYHEDIPIQKIYLQWMSGRYAGFSHALLNQMWQGFRELPGNEIIRDQTCRSLMKQALDSQELTARVEEFIECIEKQLGGSVVCRYIREKTYQAAGRGWHESISSLNSITINPDELIASITDPLQREIQQEAAINLLSLLVEHRILRQRNNVFELLVVAPFLKPLTQYKVFISHLSQYYDQATELAEHLETLAIQDGKKVIPYVFNINGAINNAMISEQINRKIDESSNLIVIFEGDNFTSHYVAGEVNRWMTRWRSRMLSHQAAIFPMVMDDSPTLPHEVAAYRVIKAANLSMSSVARNIILRLIPG